MPEIGAEVHGMLTSVLLEDPQSVTVQVREGVVTLRGSLREPELIPAAVRLASDIDGVVAVTDELTSGPAEPARRTRPPRLLPDRPAAAYLVARP